MIINWNVITFTIILFYKVTNHVRIEWQKYCIISKVIVSKITPQACFKISVAPSLSSHQFTSINVDRMASFIKLYFLTFLRKCDLLPYPTKEIIVCPRRWGGVEWDVIIKNRKTIGRVGGLQFNVNVTEIYFTFCCESQPIRWMTRAACCYLIGCSGIGAGNGGDNYLNIFSICTAAMQIFMIIVKVWKLSATKSRCLSFRLLCPKTGVRNASLSHETGKTGYSGGHKAFTYIHISLQVGFFHAWYLNIFSIFTAAIEIFITSLGGYVRPYAA